MAAPRGAGAGRRCAACLGTRTPAAADPALSATGLRQEPGLVEFFLSVGNLPTGAAIDPGDRGGRADGTLLRVRGARRRWPPPVRTREAPRRLAVLVLDTSGSMAGAPMAAARHGRDAVRRGAAGRHRPGGRDRRRPRRQPRWRPPPTGPGPPASSMACEPPARRRCTTGCRPPRRWPGTSATPSGGCWCSPTAPTPRRRPPDCGGATAAKAARTPFDTVAFRTEEATTEVLGGLSRDTGGTAYTAADVTALAGAFRSAAGAFAVQLLVTAEVPGGAGRPRDPAGDQLPRSAPERCSTSVPVRLVVRSRAVAATGDVVAEGLPRSSCSAWCWSSSSSACSSSA